MSLITQALDRMRGKPDGALAARPFSDLSAHKVISQGKKIAAMLGIESPFFRSTEGMHGRPPNSEPRKLVLPCKQPEKRSLGFDGVETKWVPVMTSSRSHAELHRWNVIAVIRLAIKAALPEHGEDRIGLLEIAELCRRHIACHQGGDRNAIRDLIMMIAVEWDLNNDSLDAQSDACLRCVANLLCCGPERSGQWSAINLQSSAVNWPKVATRI